nr:hypothetical protein [Tanacetum cinerariifolium]
FGIPLVGSEDDPTSPLEILQENPIRLVKESSRKGQNQINTGQKREAWRSREKSEAVTVDRERKTEQNAKRMAKNANTVKSYSKFKEEKKRQGPDLKYARLGNSYVYDPNPIFFDCPPDSYHPPHPTYETYSYDSYGNNSQFGYDCQPQSPFHYESEQCYNENYNSYPYDSSSIPQQYPCCARCGVPHETCHCDQLIFDEPYCKHCGGPHMNYQCQPMNQDSYNSNSLGFDQPQPPQSPVIHQPPQELSIPEMADLKQHTHPSKHLHSFCFDDDDDEDYTSAITPDEPVLSTEEPDNSLSMGDEHLDTIPVTELDEFIKSGVENLIPIPSESEGIPEHVCDVPSHDDSPPLNVSKDQFEDFSESNEEFSSTDDDSFFFDKIDYVEASPPDSELVSSEVMEIVIPEGDMLLFEAFLNDDHSFDFKTKSSSTSLNSLLEETNNFDNSSPEFTTFSNVLYDAECESDSSDDQSCSDEDVLEKIVSKPLSEEKIIPMESLRTHDSSLPISSKIDSLLDEFAESVHFDIPPFSRPPAKPPDGDTGILNIKMMGDIYDQNAFMHKLMITLASHQEKSPDLLSHRCETVKKFNTHHSHLNTFPMLIHG